MILVTSESLILISPGSIYQHDIIAGIYILVVQIVVIDYKCIELVCIIDSIHSEVIRAKGSTSGACS